MQVILLPRADRSSKGSLEDLGFSLHGVAQSVSLHHYDHWHASRDISVQREVDVVKKHITSESVLIGSELGAAVALQAITSQKIKPAACIFVDLPFDWASLKEAPLEPLLQSLKTPSLIIHTKPLSTRAKHALTKLPKTISHITRPETSEKAIHSRIKQFISGLKR